MSLDPRFVTAVSLEPYFVDKDTGAPLAGGTVEFWQDDQRTTPKLVYQLTGAPPNYEYAPLPNPVTLSAVGTIEDNFGNNVALYFFPYDSFEPDANIQLYYIVVKNSEGVIQFTREGWPNTSSSSNANLVENNVANELSNPQFVDILFSNNIPYVINFVGTDTLSVDIAPDWTLRIVHTGNGSVTITRTSVVGSSAYPGNPPYVLNILAGNNISSLKLIQKLENNPDIWSRAPGGANGYLSGTILLAPLSSVTMNYVPSVGTIQQIFTANNTSGAYAEFGGTIQLNPCNNTEDSDDGFVNIELDLPVLGTTTLSNIQVVGLSSNISLVPYDQTTVNRQRDFLFHYYNPLLQFKPINSYLVGWDFPFNPAQFLGSTLAASASGANTSRYVWDQTIVFQSANNGPAISRSAGGKLVITATNTTQFALIQYLPQTITISMLTHRLSSMISASTIKVGGLSGKISLYYTLDGALPSCTANNSIVATLDASGKPATFNGNWVEIPRSGLGDAQFTITNGEYGFSGWDISGAGITDATFFAIVVGFSSLIATETATFNSISLVPGDIPTIPAPKTIDETRTNCNFYYRKSFGENVIPANRIGFGTGESYAVQATAIGNDCFGPSQYFECPMISVPVVTLYNPRPGGALGQIANESNPGDYTLTATYGITRNGFITGGLVNNPSAPGDLIGIHWTADARLGR